MNIDRLQKNIGTICSHPGIFFPFQSYIFLISHMRSFSSLACHLLSSSSEIDGYKENHLSYTKGIDFLRLRYKTVEAIEGNLR
jgi:hypothetical protein